jgi:hypothetical protein
LKREYTLLKEDLFYADLEPITLRTIDVSSIRTLLKEDLFYADLEPITLRTIDFSYKLLSKEFYFRGKLLSFLSVEPTDAS